MIWEEKKISEADSIGTLSRDGHHSVHSCVMTSDILEYSPARAAGKGEIEET